MLTRAHPKGNERLMAKKSAINRQKKREKLKFGAQGNIIKEVTGTVNHLGDKDLGDVGKGEGFLGVLAQWRDTEVL